MLDDFFSYKSFKALISLNLDKTQKLKNESNLGNVLK